MGALDAVRAERRANWDALDAAGPGAFTLEDGMLIYRCPCGCGETIGLPVHKAGEAELRRPSWQWDGNDDQPTLTPSIRRMAGCLWHGFLTAGEWQPCGDSGR